MAYNIREGVILRNICDEWLLIAAGDAAEHCMYVRHVNDTLAWYWQKIENGLTAEEIVAEASVYYDANVEILNNDVNHLINQLYEWNYLIAEQ